jgi:cytochrome c5
MKAKHFFPGLLMVAAIGAASLSAPMGHTQAAPPAAAQPHVDQYKSAKKAPMDDEGTRVFAQNCSRCHRTPDGFSPRIAGTIVRHMRVRANLSAHDEQVLMKYFNQ